MVDPAAADPTGAALSMAGASPRERAMAASMSASKSSGFGFSPSAAAAEPSPEPGQSQSMMDGGCLIQAREVTDPRGGGGGATVSVKRVGKSNSGIKRQ